MTGCHRHKRLWEGADERAGTKAWGRDTFNSWNDVDNAFKAWAEQFAMRLDEHESAPNGPMIAQGGESG